MAALFLVIQGEKRFRLWIGLLFGVPGPGHLIVQGRFFANSPHISPPFVPSLIAKGQIRKEYGIDMEGTPLGQEDSQPKRGGY